MRAVTSSRVEGFSDGRLPSMSGFLGLYETQGETAGGMTLPPLTRNANRYTTTDVYPDNKEESFAFGPTHSAADPRQAYFRSTEVGVWAVRLEAVPTPVPGPTTLMLMLAGIDGLVAWRGGRCAAGEVPRGRPLCALEYQACGGR